MKTLILLASTALMAVFTFGHASQPLPSDPSPQNAIAALVAPDGRIAPRPAFPRRDAPPRLLAEVTDQCEPGTRRDRRSLQERQWARMGDALSTPRHG